MFQLRTRIQSHRAARSRSTLRGRSPRARPLVLEALEDRCLLSSYSFKVIAETGPQYSGLVVGQAINNLGQAAFVADLKSGGEAIYRTESDGGLTSIAQTDGLIRDFYLAPYMNDSGTVAFGADLTDGTQAIFTGSGGDLTRIADTGPDSPLSSLPPSGPRIGSDGTVTSQGLLVSGAKLFFVGNGGLLSILYVTGGRFSEFPGSPASQVNGNTVAFRATLSVDGTRGVFTGSGGPTTTIVTSDSEGGIYSSFISVEINDAGDLAIDANRAAGGMAIVTVKDGKLSPFVDTDGPFSQFFAGRLSINNQGTVIFGADLAAGGHGIFQGPDPVADKIIATGDPLDGSTVAGFPAPPDNYLNPRGLNNAGQIIFRVDLADGRRVLVRADPDGDRHAGSGQSGKLEVFINLSGPDVSPSLVTTTQELKGPGPAAAAKPDDASSQLVFLGSLQGIQSQTTQVDHALKIARGHGDLLDQVFADLADSLFDHAL